jgi:excisionase family DNA binding protein
MKGMSLGHKLAYTVREAAELLSLSRSLIYEQINAGNLETIKVGRARRITARQLESYITEREAEFSGKGPP